MAKGVKQTHVKGSKVDMSFLADLAKNCGANEVIINQIKKANSARHVQEIIQGNKMNEFFKKICSKVYDHMKEQSENKVVLEVVLFDFDGSVLSRYPEK